MVASSSHLIFIYSFTHSLIQFNNEEQPKQQQHEPKPKSKPKPSNPTHHSLQSRHNIALNDAQELKLKSQPKELKLSTRLFILKGFISLGKARVVIPFNICRGKNIYYTRNIIQNVFGASRKVSKFALYIKTWTKKKEHITKRNER